MRRVTGIAIAAAFLLGVGVYHGLATDRWSNANADDHPAKWLANPPLDISDWKGEILPREAEDDPKTGVITCRFTQPRSGRWVLTAVTSGRAGRVAIHNPEHCYLGSGYKVVDSIHQESLPLGEGTAAFWTGHFTKKKSTGLESIRIYWGWTTDGRWQAPEYPRLFFAAAPRMHKLYMIHPVTGNDSADDQAAYHSFMSAYLAELNRRLAP
jgi:hypothetical protein